MATSRLDPASCTRPCGRTRRSSATPRPHPTSLSLANDAAVRYVQDMRSDLGKLSRARYRMTEVLRKMDSFVDASDPDVDVPNSIHAYQSAERARKEFPEDKAMQVAALIHDFGKVLVEFGYPQWTIVGDTYEI
jgi:inositol oxygenase